MKAIEEKRKELKDCLRILGFNQQQIDKAVENSDTDKGVEDMVEDGIRFISRERFKGGE